MSIVRASLLFAILLIAFGARADLELSEGTNLSVDSHPDRGIVFDLLGGLWLLEDGKTAATELLAIDAGVSRPRWSPGGDSIVFESNREIVLFDTTTGRQQTLVNGERPRWHPGGERILYVARDGSGGTQLFEIDVETTLVWQLTHGSQDAIEGAWSKDGAMLAIVTRDDGQYGLRLRSVSGERMLFETPDALSSPSFRPDTSMVTFLRHGDRLTADMAILSSPVLVRTLISEPDLFDSPIVWRDRQRMLYAANGKIRRREFNSWIPRSVPFRATVSNPVATATRYEIPPPDQSGEPWVLRVGQLFDGRHPSWQTGRDIVIHGEAIVAVEAVRDRGGLQVIAMSGAVAIPGLIDACGSAAADPDAQRALLAQGVLTRVQDKTVTDIEPLATDSMAPRQLEPTCADAIDARQYVWQQSRTASPQGFRYDDSAFNRSGARSLFLSGIAAAPDATEAVPTTAVSASEVDDPGQVALATATNGWPVETAALAELHALGLASGHAFDALRAASGLAADYLGLTGRLGEIRAGAYADIVLLPGDPVRRLAQPIAIVKSGRLFSRRAIFAE